MLDEVRYKKLFDEVVGIVIDRLRKRYPHITRAFYHDAAHVGTEDAFLERCPREHPGGPYTRDDSNLSVYILPKPTDDPDKFKNVEEYRHLVNRAADLAKAELRKKGVAFLDRRSRIIPRGDRRRPYPLPAPSEDEPPEQTEATTKTGIHDWLAHVVSEKELARLKDNRQACQRIKTYIATNANKLEKERRVRPAGITSKEIKIGEAILNMLKEDNPQEIDLGPDEPPSRRKAPPPILARGTLARNETADSPPLDSILNDPRLSAREREVLHERFYGKLEWKAVAKRHGADSATVRRWYNQALAKLQKIPPENR